MNADVYIGIDPDNEKSGFALLINNEIETYKVSFSDFIFNWLEKIHAMEKKYRSVTVFVEGSWLIKGFYKRHIFNNNLNVLKKISYDIGMNHSIGKKIVEILEYEKINVKTVEPLKLEKKITTYELLDVCKRNQIMLHFPITNQEERDSAHLVISYAKQNKESQN